ncbi:MAG: sialidase family protein [Candidatus Theseobacter exili]|nr:sialidase family protein [Candidatus Theseobacter exili]
MEKLSRQLQAPDIPKRSYDEHHFVELKDGRIWALTRTLYGVGQSFSYDKGKTWSKAENSNLGGPSSRFFIGRLQSGNLLLVNHSGDEKVGTSTEFISLSDKKRCRLTAWLSDDDGLNWRGGLLLDERENVSYPDVCQSTTGSIYLIYDHERHKLGEILLARFSEKDILNGFNTSSEFYTKHLVDRTNGVKS